MYVEEGGEGRAAYGLAIFGEVHAGMVWWEDVVGGSDDWARHYGGGLQLF